MRNKAKDFPKTPFQGKTPEEMKNSQQAMRADGTINSRPQERMRRDDK